MKRFVILTLIAFLITFKDSSAGILSNLFTDVITTTSSFSVAIFGLIGDYYKRFFHYVAAIGLVIILTKRLVNQSYPTSDIVNFCIALGVASAIAFNVSVFYEFNKIFFSLMTALNSKVITGTGSDILSNTDSASVLKEVEIVFSDIIKFAASIESGGMFDLVASLLIGLEALVLMFLFIFVEVYFTVLYAIANVAAHMMIVAMPITISFIPFKTLRPYFFSNFKGLLHYTITTTYLCLAIALIVFIANKLSIEAQQKLADSEKYLESDFLIQAIAIGVLSIFLLKMSSELTSRILNTAGSELGRAFPMLAAGAVSIAKFAGVSGVASKLVGITSAGSFMGSLVPDSNSSNVDVNVNVNDSKSRFTDADFAQNNWFENTINFDNSNIPSSTQENTTNTTEKLNDNPFLEGVETHSKGKSK